MAKNKQQKLREIEYVTNSIMKATIIRDANKVQVPQYFDSDLGVFVPITQSWGGGSSSGGGEIDLTDIKKSIEYSEKYANKAYRVPIKTERSTVISLGEDLGIQFIPIEVEHIKDSVTTMIPGYYFEIVNTSADKTIPINMSLALGTASNGNRSNWHAWNFGDLNAGESIPVLDNHGAIFDCREEIEIILLNEATNCFFSIAMLGVSNADGGNDVEFMINKAEMKNA